MVESTGDTTRASVLAARIAAGTAFPTETASGGQARTRGGRKLSVAEFQAAQRAEQSSQQQVAVQAAPSARAQAAQQVISRVTPSATSFESSIQRFGRQERDIRARQEKGVLRVKTFVKRVPGLGGTGRVSSFARGAAVGALSFVPTVVGETIIAGKKAGLAAGGLVFEPSARKAIGSELFRTAKAVPSAVVTGIKQIRGAERIGVAAGAAIVPGAGFKTGVERAIARRALVKSVPAVERPFVKEITSAIQVQRKVKPTVAPQPSKVFQTTGLKPSEVSKVIGVVKKEKGVVFGSAASSIATGGRTKLPKDIDIAVPSSRLSATKRQLRGTDVDVKPIVTTGTERGLIRGELPVPGAPRALGGLVEPFSVRTQRVLKEQGVRFTSFAEQTTRKGLGTLQVLLEREGRRAKDPVSFVESLKLQQKFATERGKVRTAEKLGKSIKTLTSPQFQKILESKTPAIRRQPAVTTLKFKPAPVRSVLGAFKETFVKSTRRPSAITTFVRSEVPKVQPRRTPTSIAPKIERPSVVPSRPPTISRPSVVPSRIPSVVPSKAPRLFSRAPSGAPSRGGRPSTQPSRSVPPSLTPSTTPSVLPKPTPSVLPSTVPSTTPSLLTPFTFKTTKQALFAPKISRKSKQPKAKRFALFRGETRFKPSLIGVEFQKAFKPITKKEARFRLSTGVGVRPVVRI